VYTDTPRCKMRDVHMWFETYPVQQMYICCIVSNIVYSLASAASGIMCHYVITLGLIGRWIRMRCLTGRGVCTLLCVQGARAGTRSRRRC
jgi:hypothetical protein